MWKQTLMAAALVAMVGGCEDRSGTSSTVPSTKSNDGSAPATATAPALVDTGFLKTAASINTLEIELARMAGKQSDNADVKSLAMTISKDHTDSNDRLKAIVDSMKVEFPTEVLQEHKDVRNRVSKFKGADFDREFMAAMVDGHKAAIDVYEKQASSGENDALKRFAQAQLPTLRMHLDQSQTLQQRLTMPPATPAPTPPPVDNPAPTPMPEPAPTMPPTDPSPPPAEPRGL